MKSTAVQVGDDGCSEQDKGSRGDEEGSDSGELSDFLARYNECVHRTKFRDDCSVSGTQSEKIGLL